MKTIIDKIYNNMYVYFGENVEMFSCGKISSKNESSYHKELVHNLIVQNLNVNTDLFDPNDEVHANLMKLSLTTNFVSFLNSTVYIDNQKYVFIAMYLTKDLDEKQKAVVSYCLEQFKKDNIPFEVGLFDNGKFDRFMPDQLDDFIECLNSSEQNTKVLKKVNQ